MSATAARGKPLPAAVRAPFETALDYDFSRVRVHDAETDARRAKSLNARAFTYGSDIVLNRPLAQTAPDTLAHELVHVAQQRNAGDARNPTLPSAGSPLEANADNVVAAMARGDRTAGAQVAPASERAIHRQGDDAGGASPAPQLQLDPRVTAWTGIPGITPHVTGPVPHRELTMRGPDRLRPGPAIPQLAPRLQPEDVGRIESFLALHAFRVGQRLRPQLDGAATTLDAVIAAVRPLVLPIIARSDIETYVDSRWRLMVLDELARVPFPTIPPTPIPNIFADIPPAPSDGPEHVRPTFSVGVNYAWHVALAPGNAATHDRTLQLQIGEDSPLQRIFQVSYNVDNQQTQIVVGGQATSPDVKLIGEFLKITGFVQVLAGVAWTGSPASGMFSMFQPSAGGQLTLDFGPVQLAIQAAGSITAVQGSAPTAEFNLTPQVTIPLESKPSKPSTGPASTELAGRFEIRDWVERARFTTLQRLDIAERVRLVRSLVGGGAIIDVDIDALEKMWEATADFERPRVRPIIEGAIPGIGDPARARRLTAVLTRPAFPR